VINLKTVYRNHIDKKYLCALLRAQVAIDSFGSDQIDAECLVNTLEEIDHGTRIKAENLGLAQIYQGYVNTSAQVWNQLLEPRLRSLVSYEVMLKSVQQSDLIQAVGDRLWQ